MKIHLIKNYKKFAISTSIVVITLLVILALIFGNTKTEKNSETISLETASTFNENQEEDESLVIVKEDIEEISEEVLDAQDESEEDEENKEEEKQENNNGQKDNNQKINNSKQTSSGSQYYIKVNYGANVVTVYKKDDNGNYTIPIKAMICSTGTATPKSGVYSVKTKWTWGALFGNVYGHYVTKIVGNILFHSVPYLSNDPSTLEYWEYDKLGTSASMGCVRLKISDAKWIFDYMPYGTPVEFYSDSNPGPLGKPGAQKISGNEQCRGWDPTDPDSRNPWHNVSKQEEKKEEKKEEPKQETKQETNNNVENNTTKNEVNNQISTNTTNTNNTQSNTQTSNTNNTNSVTTNTVTNNTTTNNTSVQNSNTVKNNVVSNTVKNTNTVSQNTTNTKTNTVAQKNNTTANSNKTSTNQKNEVNKTNIVK